MKTQNIFATGTILLILSSYCYSQGDISGSGLAREEEHFKEFERFLADGDSKTPLAARKDFVVIFTEAQNALSAQKLEAAKKAVGKLHNYKNPNKYEQSRIYLADYWYKGLLGDKNSENEAAAKLMALGAGYVDSSAYVEAGIRLLKRQFNAQNYGAAIDTLAALRQEPESAAELASINTAVTKLDQLSASSQDLSLQIKADDSGKWNTKLLRPTFFMDKINGEISSIDFNCENKQLTLPFKAESVMSTPSAWGSCSIKVNSTPNTTFNFVQLVNKPTT